MAIQPTKLIIALSALIIICLAGWLMDFSKKITGRGDSNTELQIYMLSPAQKQQFVEKNKEFAKERTGVFSTFWRYAADRFQGAVDCVFAFDIPGVVKNITEFFKAVWWALRYHFLYCIAFGIILLAVTSIAGGAICRIAALQTARDEKPGLTESLQFSIQRFSNFFTTPLAPLGIIIFCGVFLALLGLIGNIPRLGELIIGIFILFALIIGALIAIVLIGSVAGCNLMFPAVAYDGSDCFDAISRSFNYIYARPWHMLFYTAITAVYGAICYMFVRLFIFITLWVTHWFIDIGLWVTNSSHGSKLEAIWPAPEFMNLLHPLDLTSMSWSESFAGFLIYLFVLIVSRLLVISFIISFYLSANTIIYSLMRYNVDKTATEDIYTPADQTQPAATELKPLQPPEQSAPTAQPD
jgi:hypothetical protein